MHRMRRLLITAGMALAGLAAVAPPAKANLIKPSAGRAYPDIAADINGTVSYTYNSSTGTGNFHMTNTPYLIAGGNTAAQEYAVQPLSNGTRQQVLNLQLNGDGQLIKALDSGGAQSPNPANNYSLIGKIKTPDGQVFQGLLLSGTPTDFGWMDLSKIGIEGSDVFDVSIKVTDGALKPYFGDEVYMRLTPELGSTFLDQEGLGFRVDFSATKATSNTRSYKSPQPFPVPEPAALMVLVAGGVGLACRRRLRRVR